MENIFFLFLECTFRKLFSINIINLTGPHHVCYIQERGEGFVRAAQAALQLHHVQRHHATPVATHHHQRVVLLLERRPDRHQQGTAAQTNRQVAHPRSLLFNSISWVGGNLSNCFSFEQDWDLLFDLEDNLEGFAGLCKDLTRTHIYCALGEIEIRLNIKEYKGYTVSDKL